MNKENYALKLVDEIILEYVYFRFILFTESLIYPDAY